MPTSHHTAQKHGASAISLHIAADLQDNLLIACNDLERLQALLSHACDDILKGFHGAVERVRNHTERPDALRGHASSPELCNGVLAQLSGAITALQFQDMASQLIAHTNKRLRNCADRLAREAMLDDEDGETVVEEAPLRPNPVTQDEMDAGSIELF